MNRINRVLRVAAIYNVDQCMTVLVSTQSPMLHRSQFPAKISASPQFTQKQNFPSKTFRYGWQPSHLKLFLLHSHGLSELALIWRRTFHVYGLLCLESSLYLLAALPYLIYSHTPTCSPTTQWPLNITEEWLYDHLDNTERKPFIVKEGGQVS